MSDLVDWRNDEMVGEYQRANSDLVDWREALLAGGGGGGDEQPQPALVDWRLDYSS